MSIEIALFGPEHAQKLSELIIRNFMEINIRHYPVEEMQALSQKYTPEHLIEYGRKRKIFVALENGVPVGTGGYGALESEGTFGIFSVFVLPDAHGRGIGRMLMCALEAAAKADGAKSLVLWASQTAREFYEKLGFAYEWGIPMADENNLYKMRKAC